MGVSTASGYYAHGAVAGYLMAGYHILQNRDLSHCIWEFWWYEWISFVSFLPCCPPLKRRAVWQPIFLLWSCDMALMLSSAFPLHQSSKDANKLNFTGPRRCEWAPALAGSTVLQIVSFYLSQVVALQQRLNLVLSRIQILEIPPRRFISGNFKTG